MSSTTAETTPTVPTLYEWAGGLPALERLTAHFYACVPTDSLLAPIFAGMSADHPRHMVRHHLGRNITEEHRLHWQQMLLESADAVGLPADSESYAAVVGYLEGLPGGPYQPEGDQK